MIWVSDYGFMNVLHAAAFSGHVDILRLLIETDGRGRDLLYAKDRCELSFCVCVLFFCFFVCVCVYEMQTCSNC
jgi:hypothetical protein